MASGKHVVVIGGGDTGSDCVGTCNRHSAASLAQFELIAANRRNKRIKPLVWPLLADSSCVPPSSQEEGATGIGRLQPSVSKGRAARSRKLILQARD